MTTRADAMLAWSIETFGPGASDREERLTRFLEEAIELAHADDLPKIVIAHLVERVYTRRRGPVRLEIGQALLTLEAYAASIGVTAETEAAREFARIQAIPKEEWARRHRAKAAAGIAR